MLAAPRRLPIARQLAIVVATIAGTAIIGAALLHFARGLDPAQIHEALAALSAGRITAALALTTASYVLLALFDGLALASLGEKVAWPVIGRASFTGYTVAHNLGFGLLTGGSARLVIYRQAGVPPTKVARVVLMASAAFWLGIAAIAGAALLLGGGHLALFGVALSPLGARLAGAAVVALLVALPFSGRLLHRTSLRDLPPARFVA